MVCIGLTTVLTHIYYLFVETLLFFSQLFHYVVFLAFHYIAFYSRGFLFLSSTVREERLQITGTQPSLTHN